jgi:hypothetical protein
LDHHQEGQGSYYGHESYYFPVDDNDYSIILAKTPFSIQEILTNSSFLPKEKITVPSSAMLSENVATDPKKYSESINIRFI